MGDKCWTFKRWLDRNLFYINFDDNINGIVAMCKCQNKVLKRTVTKHSIAYQFSHHSYSILVWVYDTIYSFLALFKCPVGMKCDNHICKIECNSNDDCFRGQMCVSRLCEDECSLGNIQCQWYIINLKLLNLIILEYMIWNFIKK